MLDESHIVHFQPLPKHVALPGDDLLGDVNSYLQSCFQNFARQGYVVIDGRARIAGEETDVFILGIKQPSGGIREITEDEKLEVEGHFLNGLRGRAGRIPVLINFKYGITS